MEALGIKHLFSEPFFGGFGSDYCNPDNSEQSWKDRAELVKIAANKAQKHFPGNSLAAKTLLLLTSADGYLWQLKQCQLHASKAICSKPTLHILP